MWITNARVGDKNEYLAPQQTQTTLIIIHVNLVKILCLSDYRYCLLISIISLCDAS